MSHTMRTWERIVEARPREEVMICEQQCGFVPRNSSKKKGHNCFEDAEGEVWKRSEKAALCLCGSGEYMTRC